MKDLTDAYDILNRVRLNLCDAPQPLWDIVQDARRYVERRIKYHLSDHPDHSNCSDRSMYPDESEALAQGLCSRR